MESDQIKNLIERRNIVELKDLKKVGKCPDDNLSAHYVEVVLKTNKNPMSKRDFNRVENHLKKCNYCRHTTESVIDFFRNRI